MRRMRWGLAAARAKMSCMNCEGETGREEERSSRSRGEGEGEEAEANEDEERARRCPVESAIDGGGEEAEIFVAAAEAAAAQRHGASASVAPRRAAASLESAERIVWFLRNGQRELFEKMRERLTLSRVEVSGKGREKSSTSRKNLSLFSSN